MRVALEWLAGLFEWAPRREIRLQSDSRPQVRALVDASGRGENGGWLGVILTVRVGESPLFSSWQMPEDIYSWLRPRGNYIQFLEMSAAILLLTTFPHQLRGCDVIIFCDNTAQAGSLAKGFSSSWDMAVIAGVFWELACKLSCDVFIQRVPSEFNLADCPSRPSDGESRFILEALGARWTNPGSMDPLLSALGSLSARSALQDPDPGRKRKRDSSSATARTRR